MTNRMYSGTFSSGTPSRGKFDQETVKVSKLIAVQETPNTGISRGFISSFILNKPAFEEVIKFIDVKRRLAVERMRVMRSEEE